MVTAIVVTAAVTTAAWAGVAAFVARRVASRLGVSPARLVWENVVRPAFGGRVPPPGE